MTLNHPDIRHFQTKGSIETKLGTSLPATVLSKNYTVPPVTSAFVLCLKFHEAYGNQSV